jgi:hypothetical protein
VSEYQLEVNLRVAAQIALLGAVPPMLRSVSCELRGKTIHFLAVFEPGASDDDRELLSVAATEVLASFDSSHGIDEQFVDVPVSERPPRLEHVMFERAEGRISVPLANVRWSGRAVGLGIATTLRIVVSACDAQLAR